MTKTEKYELFILQAESLVKNETDLIANISNLMALIKQTFGFWWCGVYFSKGNQLVLGPFQGPVACTRIPFGKGVCGTVWKEQKTINVPDVDQFIGHIACSNETRSEIVIPIFKNNTVFGVIDIDSKEIHAFDAEDEKYMWKLAQMISLI